MPTGQCFLLSQPGASIALSATFQRNLMKREQPAASPQRVCNGMQGIHHSAVYATETRSADTIARVIRAMPMSMPDAAAES